jgi:hypothetical protein
MKRSRATWAATAVRAEAVGQSVAAAFAKIGFLMASSRRSDKALHATNLHVNEALYPQDTIQSRLPDSEWLERWLDEQIHFDDTWENRFVGGILRNLSNLLGRQPGCWLFSWVSGIQVWPRRPTCVRALFLVPIINGRNGGLNNLQGNRYQRY